MPIETGKTIAELDQNWPDGQDSATFGDDHLRLIKSILKTQFPGSAGNGFSKPITATEDDLNNLSKNLIDIKKSISDMFPVGSVVFRLDNINPATLYGGKWQLLQADASITFGNGTTSGIGYASGDNNPKAPLPAHSHTASFSGNATGGNHVHGYSGGNDIRNGSDSSGERVSSSPYGKTTTGSGAHTHTVTGTVTVNSAGTSNPTINVRGARYAMNVWKRTA